MNERKLLPLALLYATEKNHIEGRTRFQKLTFLMQQECDLSQSPDQLYGFKAYDYGPFSSELYDDLDDLIESDLVKESMEEVDEEEGVVKYEYELKSSGESLFVNGMSEEIVDCTLQEAIRIVNDYGNLSLPELIDSVYTRYPKYAENSVLC